MNRNSSISSFRILATVLGILGIFLFAETVTRVVFFGPEAIFHPRDYRPVPMKETSLVTPSGDPNIPYRLKPFLNTYYKGAKFSTNEYGFRDHSFKLNHSPGVTRIALLGASIDMGTGVDDEEIYPQLLEKFLQKSNPGRYEILNFAITGYKHKDIVPLYDRVVRPFKPDMVIFPLYYGHLDRMVLDASGENLFAASNRNSLKDLLDIKRFLETSSFFYQVLRRWFEDHFGDSLSLWEERIDQKESAKREGKMTNRILLDRFIKKLRKENVVVIIVNMKRPSDKPFIKQTAAKKQLENWVKAHPGVYLIDTYPELDPLIGKQDRIYFSDNHPNARAHYLYAEAIYKQLWNYLNGIQFRR